MRTPLTLAPQSQKFDRFGLVLMVNHACNLRCTYCYTGDKFSRPMPLEIATKSIDRAFASMTQHATLELGFFGGEPLLEAHLIQQCIQYARTLAARYEDVLQLNITTNGTITTPAATAILLNEHVDLAISIDGTPEVHDKHRLTVTGQGSSSQVLATIDHLVSEGRDFKVVMVVRPDTVDFMQDGILFLRERGVTRFDLSLDLWTRWTPRDVTRLEERTAQLANLWVWNQPNLSINWFDEKAAEIASVPTTSTARCGFGRGEIAVAPSGNLYPCERLIGADEPGNQMRLPGNALDGSDFLSIDAAPDKSHPACDDCEMCGECNTFCRCSNFVRSGDVRTPDGLLCRWNQACMLAIEKVLGKV